MQSYRRKCRKFRFVNSAPAEQGARTAAGVFTPNGRHLFLHRLSGVLEPRRRFTLTGGEFFAEIQRGVALCGARESAAPAAGAKRKGHLRFPPSCGSPLSLEWSGADCRHVTAAKRSTTEDFFFRRDALRALMYPRIRSVRYRSATQSEGLRRRGIAVPRDSLARCYRQGLRR